MSERLKIGSGSDWEDIVGYSRIVRVGNIIEVAGTTSMDGDVLIGEGDIYVQTQFVFKKIEKGFNSLYILLPYCFRRQGTVKFYPPFKNR